MVSLDLESTSVLAATAMATVLEVVLEDVLDPVEQVLEGHALWERSRGQVTR